MRCVTCAALLIDPWIHVFEFLDLEEEMVFVVNDMVGNYDDCMRSV